jgi:hypothetical protein
MQLKITIVLEQSEETCLNPKVLQARSHLFKQMRCILCSVSVDAMLQIVHETPLQRSKLIHRKPEATTDPIARSDFEQGDAVCHRRLGAHRGKEPRVMGWWKGTGRGESERDR